MPSPPEPLPAEVRRERILALVAAHEFVRVGDLSTMFGISDVTVRADLGALEERNALRRVRGGAVAPARPSPPGEAIGAAAAEKVLIGAAAAALVRDGDSVILDAGATTACAARALAARGDLRDVVVFTNGLDVALGLEAAIPRIAVVLTGGTLRPARHALVDPLARHAFEHVDARTLFLGCDGVHPAFGITGAGLAEAAVKRRMLRAAARRVVVADGSKIGRVRLAAVAPVSGVDLLITGPSADRRTLGLLRERGLRVQVIAPEG